MYNMENTGALYPFEIDKGGFQCCILRDKLKKHTLYGSIAPPHDPNPTASCDGDDLAFIQVTGEPIKW